MVKIVNFMSCIFDHKKREGIEEFFEGDKKKYSISLSVEVTRLNVNARVCLSEHRI